jgi:probable HAF family extracellular repeat protein
MHAKKPISVVLLVISLAAAQSAQSQAGLKNPKANVRMMPGLIGLPGLFPAHPPTAPRTRGPIPDPVALGLAAAKVYRFATADYPGAAFSIALDSNASTAVGYFDFDPTSSASPPQAFTLTNGVYRTLLVPGASISVLSGINTAGQMVGSYIDSSGNPHGFFANAGTFSNIDFPGSTGTNASGINDSDEVVGVYADMGGQQHGFLDNAGTWTSLDYPGAVVTAAAGVNTAGDIVGVWQDAALNTHGFLYSDGAFSKVDVVGAQDTRLTSIKNSGALTGQFTDALNEEHGIRGH